MSGPVRAIWCVLCADEIPVLDVPVDAESPLCVDCQESTSTAAYDAAHPKSPMQKWRASYILSRSYPAYPLSEGGY